MTLLLIHLLFVGIWLGCVLTEALFERALLGKGREQELILTALHKKVDFLIEIPAFCIVFLTGRAVAGQNSTRFCLAFENRLCANCDTGQCLLRLASSTPPRLCASR